MVERIDPKIFGLPIEILPLNKNGIPYFLPVIIGELLNHTQEVGLFRKCGAHTKIENLGIATVNVNFSVSQNSEYTVHDLASFIKQWLRELPEPLITPSVINQNFVDEGIDSTKNVLRNLPDVNRKSLALIFALLQLVADQSDVNLMTMSNIFVCILPSITQTNKGIEVRFKFGAFFDNCIALMNANGDDFDLD